MPRNRLENPLPLFVLFFVSAVSHVGRCAVCSALLCSALFALRSVHVCVSACPLCLHSLCIVLRCSGARWRSLCLCDRTERAENNGDGQFSHRCLSPRCTALHSLPSADRTGLELVAHTAPQRTVTVCVVSMLRAAARTHNRNSAHSTIRSAAAAAATVPARVAALHSLPLRAHICRIARVTTAHRCTHQRPITSASGTATATPIVMHIAEVRDGDDLQFRLTQRRGVHSAARAREGDAEGAFAAVQHFGHNGRTRQFSLSPDPSANALPSAAAPAPSPASVADPASFLLVHHSEEARRAEAAQLEKQQLLQALFSSYSSSSSSSPAPAPSAAAAAAAAASSDCVVVVPVGSAAAAAAAPAVVPFSPYWYPLATALSLLLPQHYPSSVTRYYLPYSKWMFVGSAFGTASSVLSMQCLLYSVGVGGAGAVPAAAAIAWVLKDGVGQLGGMLFAAAVSTRFDVQPLRFRMASALVLDASVALEMLTPLAPHLFLPLAALANTGKNIAWLGAAASRASIHRSFLRRENLADVTAKSGSQTILASLVGTAAGIGLSLLTGSNTTMILAAFAVLSLGHLGATHRALQCVVINQLHARRLATLGVQFVRQMRAQTERQGALTAWQTPLSFRLSSPSALQHHEPLLPRLRRAAYRPSGADSDADADTAVHWERYWSASSSVDTAPPFERLVQAALAEPQLHLRAGEIALHSDAFAPSASASAASTGTAAQRALYDAWLAQFDSLPFVAALQLVAPGEMLPEEIAEADAAVGPEVAGVGAWARVCRRAGAVKRAAMTLWQRRRRHLPFSAGPAQGSYGYAAVSASVSSHPAAAAAAVPSSPQPWPRLHVRLLFKSGCSAEQLLTASLYTTSLRLRWAEAAEAAEAGTCAGTASRPFSSAPSDSPSSSAVAASGQRESPAKLALRLHHEALQLLRLDAESGAAAAMAAAATDPAAAEFAAESTPTPPRPAPAEATIATPTSPDDAASLVPTAPSALSAAPRPLPSRFVLELRAAGFQTECHFVEDDNPVRIQLQRQSRAQLH